MRVTTNINRRVRSFFLDDLATMLALLRRMTYTREIALDILVRVMDVRIDCLIHGFTIVRSFKSEMVEHGLHEWFRPDGNILSRVPFIDGNKHGLSLRWYSNGQLESSLLYQHGTPGRLFEWTRAGKQVRFLRHTE